MRARHIASSPLGGEVLRRSRRGGALTSYLRARRLRQDMPGVEARLWSYLRRRQLGGHKFRRQAPSGPFVADFVCLAARLVVEVDGLLTMLVGSATKSVIAGSRPRAT